MKLLSAAANNTTSASQSIRVSSPFVTPSWHAYCWGTFNGATVTIQISNDPEYVADGSSNWFTVASGTFTVLGNLFFNARFRKIRATVTGGGVSTSLSLEVV